MLLDLIWPTLEGSSHEAEESKQQQGVGTEERLLKLPPSMVELKEHLDASERFLDDEQVRRSSIESRLQTSAGAVSVVAVVVLGPLLTFAVSNPLWSGVLHLILLGCTYLAVQLIAVLVAAWRGMSSSSYLTELPHEVLPSGDEDRTVFLQRRVRAVFARAHHERRQNCKKLGQLKLVHCATRNFLGGLLVFAVLVVGVALWKADADVRRCPPDLVCTPRSGVAASADAAAMPSGTRRSGPDETASANANPIGTTLRYTLIFSAVVVLAVGAALTNMGRTIKERLAGLAVTVIGLVWGVTFIGKLDVTGFKFDKLLEVNVNAATKTASAVSGGGATETPPIQASPQLKTVLHRALTIGPFGHGEHTLEISAIRPCVANALGEYGTNGISGWVFVGRVDKRELNRERARRYGSNQALAMARANWVVEQTTAVVKHPDLNSAIVTIGGAQRIGLAVKDSEMKADRVVDLFVMVSTTADGANATEVPKAGTCPNVPASQASASRAGT